MNDRALGVLGLFLLLLLAGNAASVSAERSQNGVGQRVFAQRCAACHGGDGHGAMGPDLRPLAAQGPVVVRRVIENGRKLRGMPAFRGRFSEAEWQALLEHIQRLK